MSTTARENFTCHHLTNSDYSTQLNGCSPSFDKSLCWYNVSYGNEGYKKCPFTFCSAIPGCNQIAEAFQVTKTCYTNGTWGDSNYTTCLDILKNNKQCIEGYCNTCPDTLRDFVVSVSLTLSIISVILLVTALVLFNSFDTIQCRRLSIHKNLAAAFTFRFAIFAIWTISYNTNIFRDCSSFVPQYRYDLEMLCQAILWLVIYFQVASVIWMLIEGLYLYSRFTVLAMRSSEPPYSVILLAGWGIPFAATFFWSIVHHRQSKQNAHSFCWLPYAQGQHLWILAGTMGFALLANLLLLLLIVLILVQKLRSENTAESAKIWKTIKATLLLVPLLGVSNIPLFYEPEDRNALYMLASTILQHSQGIFIAVLYCFLNSEIQHAVKRQLNKMSFRNFKREHFGTERIYVPDQSISAKRLGTPMEELTPVSTSNNHDDNSSNAEANHSFINATDAETNEEDPTSEQPTNVIKRNRKDLF
uniref:G_PROTEIN_RECEP_F2_4 domain-containing protein n=1 Tax=Rhabditophanes sp. KR3021 TaxID=114890 RepID=A0AC35U517_9BILA